MQVTLQTKPAVLVIGIGNTMRGDDAVGSMVVRNIRKRHLENVRTLEMDGEGTSLIQAWTGAQTVVIIDAISSGAKPGTVHKIDAVREPLRGKLFARSTHAFGLREAVELARSLHRLPPRLIIYGIVGKHFSIGEEISTELRKAASRVADCILEESGSTN